MRLLAGISRTTLECFHRDVYRPRLALLLLVLLSIVARQDYARGTSSSSAATSHEINAGQQPSQWTRLFGQPKDTTHMGIRRQIDAMLARLPAKLRNGKSTVSVRWVKADTATEASDQQHRQLTNAEAVAATRALLSKNKSKNEQRSRKTSASKDPRSGRKTNRSATTRNVLMDLFNADALSVLVALHVLWMIRFGSMLLDDLLDKESFSATARSRFAPTSIAMVMLWLVFSFSLACLSVTYSWADTLQRWGIARRADEDAVSWSIACIKYLELSATLASFASPLCRLRTSDMSPISRRKVSLPSPSHSPALIDLLPIPTGLANIISGRELPAARSTTNTRRRMAAHWAAPSMHGRRMIASPVPPQSPTATAAAMTINAQPEQLMAPPTNPAQMTRRPTVGLAEPLRLPSSGKAPRVQGMRVNVDTPWLIENSVIVYGHLVGALQYAVILFTLPSFAPTSFPSLLSAISARSELCAVAATWSAARRSVECLEFVRRRWSTPASAKPTTAVEYTAVCSICYETVESGEDEGVDEKRDDGGRLQYNEDCCLLDCGHRLHAVCLVQWLTKQTFCPCCHATLKATPPHLSTNSNAQPPSTTSATAS